MKKLLEKRNLKIIISLILILSSFACTNDDEKDLSELPTPPKNILITEKTETAIVLSWSSSDAGKTRKGVDSAIDAYEIEISKNLDLSNPLKKEIRNSSIEIAGLEGNGTLYYIRLRVRNSSGIVSEFSKVLEVVIGTKSKASPPESPTEVSVVNGSLTQSQAIISWTPPTRAGRLKNGSSAQIALYKVEYSISKDFSFKKEIFTPDVSTQITILELEPSTKYFVRVFSKNNSKDDLKEFSVSSSIIEFTTQEAQPRPPSEPKNIVVESGTLSENSVTLTWDAPESKGFRDSKTSVELVKYEIQYSLSEDFSADRWTEEVQAIENEIMLDKLKPATKYYVRIRAINDNLEEVKKQSIYTILSDGFTTEKPLNSGEATPPGKVSQLNIPDDSIEEIGAKVVWEAPVILGKRRDGTSANILQYIVEYADNNAFDNKKSLKVGSKIFEKSITNLKVSTVYYVRIKAKNSNRVDGLDESVSSVEIFSTQSPTPPSAPTDFKATVPDGELGKTQVYLTWQYNQSGDVGLKGDGTTRASLLGFEIEYSIDNFNNDLMKSEGLIPIESTSFTVSNLKPNRFYSFRIRALNNNNFKDPILKEEASSEFIFSENIKTLAGAENPVPPSGIIELRPDNIKESRTTLIISWQSPSDTGKTPNGEASSIVKYILEYVEGSIFSESNIGVKSLETSNLSNLVLNVTGLKANTQYAFRLIAVNSNTGEFESFSKSIPSPPAIFTTRDLSEKPMAPSSIINEFFPGSLVKISWEAPINLGTGPDGTDTGVALQGYKYRYYIQDTEDAEKPEFSELYTETSVNLRNLRSGKIYIFEIKTLTENSTIYEDSRESEIETYRFVLGNIENIITITDENNAEGMSTLMLSGDGNTASTLILNYTLNDNIAESNAVITVEAQAKSGDDNLGVVESAVAADRLSGTITYTAPNTFDNSKETVDVVVSIAIDNPEGEDSYPKASRTIRLTRPMLTAIELPESTEASPLVFKQGASDVQTVAVTTVPSGAKVTYTSDPELPKGFTINPNTGVISGTPEDSMTSPRAYTIIATPTSESVYINTVRAVVYIKARTLLKSITANDVQSLIYTGSQVTVASFTKSPENATVTYSSTELPVGLNINNSTGVISGTPTAATASKNYTITAQGNGDYHGSRSVDIIFEVASTLTEISIPGDASTQANPLTYNEGQAITATSAVTTTPANIPVTYSITSPSTGLPSGLSLDSSTGVISGTPTGGFNASTKYTITGTATGNNRGSASTDIYIKIKES